MTVIGGTSVPEFTPMAPVAIKEKPRRSGAFVVISMVPVFV